MSDSPASVLFDANGQPLATAAGTPASKALTVQTDPAHALKVDPGVVHTIVDSGSVTATVDTSGLATSAKQDAQQTTLGAIDTKLAGTLAVDASGHGLATEATAAAAKSDLDAIKTAVQAPLHVVQDNIPATQDVHVTNVAHVIVDSGSLTATVDETLLAKEATLSAIDSKLGGTLVVDGSAHTQPVSDGGGSLTVDGTVAVTNLPADAESSDTLDSLNDEMVVGPLSGVASLAVQLSGTWTGTVVFQQSYDGVTYSTKIKGRVENGTSFATSSTANGSWLFAIGAGAKYFKVRMSLFTSGSCLVLVRTSSATPSIATDTTVVSAASLPLPSGAATETTLGTRLADSTFTGRINTQGQKAMAASTPVVIASDQSSVHTTIDNASIAVTGTVSVSGVATAANQTTGNTSLSSIDGKTPALGQAAMAASTPVVISSNQSAIPVTDNSGSLTVDSAQLPATLGQKTMANSVAVTLASDQSALPISGSVGITGTITPGVPADLTTSGSITGAGQSVTLAINGQSAVAVQLTGSYSGHTLLTEVSVDGTNYVSVGGQNVGGNAYTASNGLGNAIGIYLFPCEGAVSARVRCTVFGSGTVTVTMRASAGNPTFNDSTGRLNIRQLSSTSDSVVVTGNVGVSGQISLADPAHSTWVAAVKDANTAAVGADQALVVAISPNNTVPVSASSLPLPTGAATSAKQPALGTAGSASADVLTVQGIASMTALKVDGSAVTQPVSGTVSVTGVALDATLMGGSAVSQLKSGAKGTSAAALVTSSASGANHQALDVAIYDAAGNQVTSFGGGTQYTNASAQATPTGTVALGFDGSNVRALKTDSAGSLVTVATADAVATGTITAFGQSVQLTCAGYNNVVVQLIGTFNASLISEVSLDGTNWYGVSGRTLTTSPAYGSSSAQSNGTVAKYSCSGFKYFRMRAASGTSGSTAVTIEANNTSAGEVSYAMPVTISSGGLTSAVTVVGSSPIWASGNLNSLNATLGFTVNGNAPPGQQVLTLKITPTSYNATLTVEWSVDNLIYQAGGVFYDLTTGAEYASLVLSGTSSVAFYGIRIPAAYNFFRVKASAFTSGTCAASLAATGWAKEPDKTLATPATTNPTVTTSTTSLLSAGRRSGFILLNTGAVDCYVALASTATASGTGYNFILKAGEQDSFNGNFKWTGPMSAITASGSTTLVVTELN